MYKSKKNKNSIYLNKRVFCLQIPTHGFSFIVLYKNRKIKEKKTTRT